MPPPPVFITAATFAKQSARSAQRRALRGAIGRTIVPPFLRRREGRRWAKRRAAPLLVLFHGLSLNFFSMAKVGLDEIIVTHLLLLCHDADLKNTCM